MIRTTNSISIKFFIGMHLFILAETISKNQQDTTEPPCSSEPASEAEVER